MKSRGCGKMLLSSFTLGIIALRSRFNFCFVCRLFWVFLPLLYLVAAHVDTSARYSVSLMSVQLPTLGHVLDLSKAWYQTGKQSASTLATRGPDSTL